MGDAAGLPDSMGGSEQQSTALPSAVTEHGDETLHSSDVSTARPTRTLPLSRWMVRRRAELTAGVISAMLAMPVFHELLTDPSLSLVPFRINDWSEHVAISEKLQFWPLRIPGPYPVFYALVRIVGLVTGQSMAAASVGAAALGMTIAVVVAMSRSDAGPQRPLPTRWAIVVAVWFALYESPSVLLLTNALLGDQLPIATPLPVSVIRWGSPTHQIMLPFAILFIPLVLRVVSRAETGMDLGRKTEQKLAVVTIVGLLAKPVALVALGPGVAIYLILWNRWTRRTVEAVGRWVVLPALPIVIWQLWWAFTRGRPAMFTTVDPAAEDIRIVFTTPMERFETFAFGQSTPAHWVMVLLPLLCIAMGGRRFLKDPPVSLLGCALLPTLFLMLCFKEEHPLLGSADLHLPFHLVWVLLNLYCIKFLVGEVRDIRAGISHRSSWWIAPIGAYAAASIASGILVYLWSLGIIY